METMLFTLTCVLALGATLMPFLIISKSNTSGGMHTSDWIDCALDWLIALLFWVDIYNTLPLLLIRNS